jgi:hypothetical protein
MILFGLFVRQHLLARRLPGLWRHDRRCVHSEMSLPCPSPFALPFGLAHLAVFNAIICIFVLVSLPRAIPIPSVAFGVKLGEHGADYTTTCELKSLESVTNQADSNLARTRDKDRCSRHT